MSDVDERNPAWQRLGYEDIETYNQARNWVRNLYDQYNVRTNTGLAPDWNRQGWNWEAPEYGAYQQYLSGAMSPVWDVNSNSPYILPGEEEPNSYFYSDTAEENLNWEPTYQTFTLEQLAQAGVDLEDFWGQYAGNLNPNGDMTQEMYAGMPIASGYVDQNGQFVGQIAPGIYQAAYLRRNTDPMAWVEANTPWKDITSSTAWAGMQGVLNQMTNYPSSSAYMQDRAASLQNLVETLRGWDPGTYTERMSAMESSLSGGIAGMQGLSEADKTKYQRQIRSQIDQMTADTRQMVGAMGASGRSIAAFDAAINARSSIGDYQIQSQLALMENDYAKKLLEYNALSQQRDQAQAQGLAGAEEFDRMLQASWDGMVTGYAAEIVALTTANEGYMAQFTQHAQAMYQSMLAELGVSAAAFETSAEMFAQANMPTTQEQWDELWDEFMAWWSENT